MDLKKDIQIDMNSLHKEWQKQPQLYADWSEAHCDAIARRDSFKIKCDIKHSILSTDIRNNYGKYGLDKKPTEAQVEALIINNPEYQKMQEELAALNKEVNMLQAARTALEHKKRALEGLERLCLANYFSTVVATDVGKEATESYECNKHMTALSSSERLRRLQSK